MGNGSSTQSGGNEKPNATSTKIQTFQESHDVDGSVKENANPNLSEKKHSDPDKKLKPLSDLKQTLASESGSSTKQKRTGESGSTKNIVKYHRSDPNWRISDIASKKSALEEVDSVDDLISKYDFQGIQKWDIHSWIVELQQKMPPESSENPIMLVQIDPRREKNLPMQGLLYMMAEHIGIQKAPRVRLVDVQNSDHFNYVTEQIEDVGGISLHAQFSQSNCMLIQDYATTDTVKLNRAHFFEVHCF